MALITGRLFDESSLTLNGLFSAAVPPTGGNPTENELFIGAVAGEGVA